MPPKLRWGILGTGNIARQFVAGLASSQRGLPAAVASRSSAAAADFARQWHVPRSLGSYADLLADPDLDAVYVSLPNSLHAPWTIRALEAGKHVLCEKPLALTAAEAAQMFDAARRAGRLLVEAFMYRSHPQTKAILDTVASGTIGPLQLLRLSFCYRTRKIDGNVRFIRELGGGSLMDIGCYCIDLALRLAGQFPASMHATARIHPTGVDELTAATLTFPTGLICSFTAGMTVQADNTAHLSGPDGFIEIPVPWKPSPSGATFTIRRAAAPKMESPTGPPPLPEIRQIAPTPDVFALEADDFAAAVQDGAPPAITPAESLANLRVLDQLRGQIGLSF